MNFFSEMILTLAKWESVAPAISMIIVSPAAIPSWANNKSFDIINLELKKIKPEDNS